MGLAFWAGRSEQRREQEPPPFLFCAALFVGGETSFRATFFVRETE